MAQNVEEAVKETEITEVELQKEIQRQAIALTEAGQDAKEVARRYGINPSVLKKWMRRLSPDNRWVAEKWWYVILALIAILIAFSYWMPILYSGKSEPLTHLSQADAMNIADSCKQQNKDGSLSVKCIAIGLDQIKEAVKGFPSPEKLEPLPAKVQTLEAEVSAIGTIAQIVGISVGLFGVLVTAIVIFFSFKAEGRVNDVIKRAEDVLSVAEKLKKEVRQEVDDMKIKTDAAAANANDAAKAAKIN